MASILVVDDHKSERLVMSAPLRKEGHELEEAESGEEACKKLNDKVFDVVVTDIKMGKVSGLDVLREIKKTSPHTIVILVTAYGTIEQAVQAIKEGAYDFITKPIDTAELLVKINKAIQQLDIISENIYLRERIKTEVGEIIGDTEEIREVYRAIDNIAKLETPVLISGENGVGKELVARAIHERSQRRDKPFIAVNLAAVPLGLIESELFGHEKGAFTGADRRRIGRFELAREGTLFLDEIAEIPQVLQVKLLRVLQEKEFQRVGGTATLKTDARIIAATNQDLEKRIEENRFREDLYYRLNVFPIHVPPLRERKEDIPKLISYFISKYNAIMMKNIEGISRDALDVLVRYDWPGNIRELQNIIQRMIIQSRHALLELEDVPLEIREPSKKVKKMDFSQAIDNLIEAYDFEKGKSLWDDTQRMLVRHMVKKVGEKNKSAELLGISKPTLYSWLEK
ncbi:MAG: sigma-54 dependent transcriptional regulator [bacterium]|nr:sigma-54 dependent transcriptional regulator [bacterium]